MKPLALITILIIVLLVSQSFFLYFMWKHITELKSNPFIYGARKYKEVNNVEITCDCIAEGKGKFLFNTSTINHYNDNIVENPRGLIDFDEVLKEINITD